jgi:hypothetical protein
MKRVLQILILLAIIAIFALESYEIYLKVSHFLKTRSDNLAKSHEAFIHSSMILEMREFRRQIPADANCFYWEHELPGEGGICRECDAIKMNYQFYPTKVLYSNDQLMLNSDFIITQKGMAWLLRARLTELFGKTGRDIEIEQVFTGNRYIVFKNIGTGEK